MKNKTIKFNNYIFIKDSCEFVTLWELNVRLKIKFFFRIILATFCSNQIFDFLFNPIWMHGYIWFFFFYNK